VIEAPLRVFIFDNRIEIHSPGLLPEGVNMESILHGASVPRNKLLFNHGINLLPYTGAGSGITRALKYTPDIKFVNDETLNEFVVTVERRGVDDRDNDRDNDRVDRDNALDNNNLRNSTNSKTDREDREPDRDNDVEHLHVSYKTLEGVQKNIVQFCSIPRSAREILNHIGYAYNSTNIANQIKPLLELGFIEMTEPDKPNSKNQKYRKVISGNS
jgi:predicted HTH transcriptional regulator